MTAIGQISQDWRRIHDAEKGQQDGPWGIQWGGQGQVDRVKKFISPHIAGKVVLEAGCGGGKWTRALFEVGARAVTAIDVHDIAIQETAKYEPRATVLQYDGETLPEGDFDVLFSFDVFLHLPPGLWFHLLQQAAVRKIKTVFVHMPILDQPMGPKVFTALVAAGNYQQPYQNAYFDILSRDMVERLISLAGYAPVDFFLPNERDGLWCAQLGQSSSSMKSQAGQNRRSSASKKTE